VRKAQRTVLAFALRVLAGLRPHHVHGHACQLGKSLLELAGDGGHVFVRRADLGNGQAAAGDDHRAAVDGATVAIYFIAAGAFSIRAGGQEPNIFHATGLPAFHTARGAFGQQHGDQVFGRAVAEKLAFVFFVKRNAVFFDQSHKVCRGEP